MDEPSVLITLDPTSTPLSYVNRKELVIGADDDVGGDMVLITTGEPVQPWIPKQSAEAATHPRNWKCLMREVIMNLMDLGLKDLGLKYVQAVTPLDQLYGLDMKAIQIKIQHAGNELRAHEASKKHLRQDFEKSMMRLNNSSQETPSSMYYFSSMSNLMTTNFGMIDDSQEVSVLFNQNVATLYGEVVTGLCVSLTVIRENWEYYMQQSLQEQTSHLQKMKQLTPSDREAPEQVRQFQQQLQELKSDYINYIRHLGHPKEMMAGVDLLERATWDPTPGMEYDIVPSMYNILHDNQTILDNLVAEADQHVRKRYQKLKQESDNLRTKRQNVLHELRHLTEQLWKDWGMQNHDNIDRDRLWNQLNVIDTQITGKISDTGALIASCKQSSAKTNALDHRYKMLQPFTQLMEKHVEIYGAGPTQSKMRDFYYRAVDTIQNETQKIAQNIQDVAEIQAYDTGLKWTNHFDYMYGQLENCQTNYTLQLTESKQNVEANYTALKKEYMLDHASRPTIHMDLHRIEKICEDYQKKTDDIIQIFMEMTMMQCYQSLSTCLTLNSQFLA